ncbi:hypothetical protein VJI72_07750, partial [Parvimonas micra]|uniref:hypothetical protein n=2 Tax=Parvimonas micra TaxID=33033 RepID=UPI002B4A5C35
DNITEVDYFVVEDTTQSEISKALISNEATTRADMDSAAAVRTGKVEARVNRVEGFAGGDLVRKGTFADGLPGDWPTGAYDSRVFRPADFGQTPPPSGEYVYLSRGLRDVFEGDPFIPGAWGGRKLRVTGYASGQHSTKDGWAGVMCLFANGSPTWVGVQATFSGQPGYRRFDDVIEIPAGVVSIRPWLQNAGDTGDISMEV